MQRLFVEVQYFERAAGFMPNGATPAELYKRWIISLSSLSARVQVHDFTPLMVAPVYR
jgi:hypothetical protein